MIFEMSVPNVVISLKLKGTLIYNGQRSVPIHSPLGPTKDTTAASDCLNGSLVTAFSIYKSIEEAVSLVCKVASISFTRMGAQSSLPFRKEIDELKLLTH